MTSSDNYRSNSIYSNYISYNTKHDPQVREIVRSLKHPECSVQRNESDGELYDPMIKFRIKLLRVYKKMSRCDIYSFHHQMRKFFPNLTDNVEEPYTLFSLLIKKGLIGPDNIQLLVESFSDMKQKELISILTDKQNPIVSIGDALTDQFVLRFCTEEIGREELWHLGVEGFKLQFVVIQRALYDSKTVLEASITVFSRWKQQAPNSEISTLPVGTMPPYNKKGLAKALSEAQLNSALKTLLTV